jgi:hypothetical protein
METASAKGIYNVDVVWFLWCRSWTANVILNIFVISKGFKFFQLHTQVIRCYKLVIIQISYEFQWTRFTRMSTAY